MPRTESTKPNKEARSKVSKDKQFKINVKAAIRILETEPIFKAERSPEDLKIIDDFLKLVEVTKSSDIESDGSASLDKYIYGPPSDERS